jgi:hypothetical protein
LTLIFDELQSILNQPPLPTDHPNAAAQRAAKSRARATLENIQAGLTELQRLAIKRAQEIIDTPPLPNEHPGAAALEHAKRTARTSLLFWNAHYGPGGPYEGLGPLTGDRDT